MHVCMYTQTHTFMYLCIHTHTHTHKVGPERSSGRPQVLTETLRELNFGLGALTPAMPGVGECVLDVLVWDALLCSLASLLLL